MRDQTSSEQPKKQVLLDVRSSKWLIGLTAFFAAFNYGFAYGAVVPVLPYSLVERSGVPEEHVQFWLSTLLVAFGLSLALSAPITAYIGDRVNSRQVPLLIGSVLALSGTAIFCVAKKPWLLLLARIFQGASNGPVYTAGLPLIADTVSQDEIGSWIGFVFSGLTGGFLVAPFLTGIVYKRAGYVPVFILVFLTLTFDLILRASVIETNTATLHTSSNRNQNERPSEQPDENSPLLNHAICSHTNSPMTDARRIPGDGSPDVYGSDDGEQVPVRSEQKCKPRPGFKSWLPRTFPKLAVLLGSRRLSAAVYGCFTYMTILTSFDATLPQFVKRTFGWDSQGAGLIFIAMSVPALAGAAFGALSDRYGPKRVSLSGFAISSVSLALLALIKNNSLFSKVGLATLLLVMDLGVELIVTPLAADMLYEADILEQTNPDIFGNAGAYALVYSLLCASQGLATAAGPAWSGLMFEEGSWAISMLTLVAICLLGSVGVFYYTGGMSEKVDDPSEGTV